ncbi:MAG: hypothetical protein FWF84_06315, partial [Kiritimatiellaeota bacterium]|nr:hypothetical protein [Kiritimatiellota bacterium]
LPSRKPSAGGGGEGGRGAATQDASPPSRSSDGDGFAVEPSRLEGMVIALSNSLPANGGYCVYESRESIPFAQPSTNAIVAAAWLKTPVAGEDPLMIALSPASLHVGGEPIAVAYVHPDGVIALGAAKDAPLVAPFAGNLWLDPRLGSRVLADYGDDALTVTWENAVTPHGTITFQAELTKTRKVTFRYGAGAWGLLDPQDYFIAFPGEPLRPWEGALPRNGTETAYAPAELTWLACHSTAGDGIPDMLKNALGIDIHRFFDPEGDDDDDGVDNLTEFIYGTDPLDPYDYPTPPSRSGVANALLDFTGAGGANPSGIAGVGNLAIPVPPAGITLPASLPWKQAIGLWRTGDFAGAVTADSPGWRHDPDGVLGYPTSRTDDYERGFLLFDDYALSIAVSPHCFHENTTGTVSVAESASPGTYHWHASAGVSVNASGPTGTVTAAKSGTVYCDFSISPFLQPVGQTPGLLQASAQVSHCPGPYAVASCGISGNSVIALGQTLPYKVSASVTTNSPCCACLDHSLSYEGDVTNAPPIYYGGASPGLAVAVPGSLQNGAVLDVTGTAASQEADDRYVWISYTKEDETTGTSTQRITVVHSDIGQGDGGITNAGMAQVSFMSQGDGSTTNLLGMIDEADGHGFSAPHWKQGANGEHRNYPIAYVRNTKPKIGATLNIRPSNFAPGAVHVKAYGDVATFVCTNAVPNGDGTLTVPPTESNAPLANKIQYYHKDGAEGFDPFTLAWEVSYDSGDTWHQAGITHHTLYVTLDWPIKDCLRYETLFYIACRHAHGETTVAGVIAKIWAHFASLAVKRVDGTPLKYYGNYNVQSYTTASLLAQGDGRCQAWARLFLDVLKIHGVQEEENLFEILPLNQPSNSNTDDHGIMINSWGFDGSGTSGHPTHPYINVLQVGWNGTTNYNWAYAEAAYVAGISGQNVAKPAALFSNHFVAHITVNGTRKLYDPSYGRVYSDLLHVENSIIGGYWRQELSWPRAGGIVPAVLFREKTAGKVGIKGRTYDH